MCTSNGAMACHGAYFGGDMQCSIVMSGCRELELELKSRQWSGNCMV